MISESNVARETAKLLDYGQPLQPWKSLSDLALPGIATKTAGIFPVS